MNKQQLASKIWESANKMRSKIEASEYKDYILGFMFYKFLSEKEEEFLKENAWDEEDIENLSEENIEDVKFIQENIGYFIDYKNLFSTWLTLGNQFEIANVTTALSAFDRLISSNKNHKRLFNNIFGTLQSGLSKLGEGAAAQSKAVRDLIHLIKIIPMDGKQDYDVLGFVYEYLIGNFAVNAGKKAGEFYTPHEVSLLMSEIIAEHLKDKSEIKIYDPTSGSGSLLINIGKSVSKRLNNSNSIKYYAQELIKATYDLTRMNLIMRGIGADNIVARNADTLADDWPYFDESDPAGTYDPLYVDAVVSNPPYSQKWDRTGKDNDPRYADYGLAPKSKADYAFLLHDLYHVKPKGIMTIVLPHGVLFRGGEEREIRKNLVEKNQIDTIIGLPANIFFGTGIPTIIMVLKKEKNNSDILFVDASKNFVKAGNKNKLSTSDVKRISDTIIERKEVHKFSRLISLEEIRNNDYNLNIPRYVDSSEPAEKWDIYSLMLGGVPNSEINDLEMYWTVFPNLKNDLFKSINPSYSSFRTDDVKKAILENSKVNEFVDLYKNEFEGLDAYLRHELIDNLFDVDIASKEQEIANDIFHRLEKNKLIDKYKAYQLLDDEWFCISNDLEILQSEGYKALNGIDPNMIIRKKDGKEEEIQNGWVGRILPFDLVIEKIFTDELNELKNSETALSEVGARLQDLCESLSEEDKERGSILSEDKAAFVPDGVKKYLKENVTKGALLEENSLEYVLTKVDQLFDEEKKLKKKIKSLEIELIEKARETIEHLSLEDALKLLEEKWITPLVLKLNELPNELLNGLVTKAKYLKEKYNITLKETSDEITAVGISLSELLNELEGDKFDMKGIEELKKLLSSD